MCGTLFATRLAAAREWENAVQIFGDTITIWCFVVQSWELNIASPIFVAAAAICACAWILMVRDLGPHADNRDEVTASHSATTAGAPRTSESEIDSVIANCP